MDESSTKCSISTAENMFSCPADSGADDDAVADYDEDDAIVLAAL